jgi:hypothetical protein
MTTVVVGGALANRPGNGGGAWVRLNWILGLRRLGCRVHFVEELGRAACTNAAGAPAAFAASVNLAWFRRVTTEFGLGDVTTLVYDGGPASRYLSGGPVGSSASPARRSGGGRSRGRATAGCWRGYWRWSADTHGTASAASGRSCGERAGGSTASGSGITRINRCRCLESVNGPAGIVEVDNREGESLFVEAVK